MPILEDTSKTSRIILHAHNDFNLSLVYTSDFFRSLFHDEVRIEHTGSSKRIKKTTDQESFTENIEEDESESEGEGKEKRGGGFIHELQRYINQFISSANSEYTYPSFTQNQWMLLSNDNKNKNVEVMLSKQRYRVIPLKRFMYNVHDDPSLYSFGTCGLDYTQIENILKDFVYQIKYFVYMGVYLSKLKKTGIFVINNVFVIMDDENMRVIKQKSDVDTMHTVIFQFLLKLLHANNISDLERMKGTSVYDTLVRLNQESVFEFI